MDEELAGLAAVMAWLDTRLAEAVEAVRRHHGIEPGGDPFRGLHLSQADAERALDIRPSLQSVDDRPVPRTPRLDWLAETFALEELDIRTIVLSLAPELDLRRQRVYAYLQDDVRRTRPSVDLALELFGPPAERLALRHRFVPTAPLARHRLVYVEPPDDDPAAPLSANTLRLDPQIVDVLIGAGSLDRRLAAWCQLVGTDDDPEDLPGAPEVVQRLALHHHDHGGVLRLHLQGRPGAGVPATARWLAHALGLPLLRADVGRVPVDSELLHVVVREARLQGALLHLEGLDGLDPPGWDALLACLADDSGPVVLSSAAPWPPPGDVLTGVVSVALARPIASTRRDLWRRALARQEIDLGEDDLAVLARRFRLGPGQIDEAAAAAKTTAWMRGGSRPTLRDVSQAARQRSGEILSELAHRIRPDATWDDLILPDVAVEQLRELCGRARYRDVVHTEWGFARGGTRGLGTCALFAGGSGTGKTTAAEVVAGELGIDIFAVDLARVVSKYIGETEKNLATIFDGARDCNAVLFFDEADALFGKRSEVRDSHDRYANIEVSYLLQRIEEFDGIAILATNRRQQLDEALLRRLSFVISFPFPDEESRKRIWSVVWPDVPRTDDVDLAELARRFALSGGNIRNIALAASFLAAADGGAVTMEHLLRATRREYQKFGKALETGEPVRIVP
ncbi:AAA family ATPase [Kribbella sp. NPDC055110]